MSRPARRCCACSVAPDDSGKVTRIIAASAVMGRRFHAGMVSSPMGDMLKPASVHNYFGGDPTSVSGRPRLDVITRPTSSPRQLQATLPGLSAVSISALASRYVHTQYVQLISAMSDEHRTLVLPMRAARALQLSHALVRPKAYLSCHVRVVGSF